MEAYFATVFEDVRHERSLILLFSLTDPDILKQPKFTNDEIEILKNLALEKLHRQRILKEYIAMNLWQKNNFLISKWVDIRIWNTMMLNY